MAAGMERASIRERAIRGGAYLMVREGAGMVVRFVGVAIVLRIIGPSAYGLYAGSLAFVTVATLTAQGGTEVFLIRQEAEPGPDLYAQAYTYLLVASLTVVAVGIGLSFAAGAFVHSSTLWIFRALLLVVPVNVLWAPAQASIERRFDFGAMGRIELTGDIVLYAVAVPLAFAHFGAWSLVIGFAAWQTWLLVSSLVVSGLRPRLSWSRTASRQFFRHSLTYTMSDWIYSIGNLANPVIVGTWIGAAGVGYVALGTRLVETASFAERAGWRVGIATMSRIQDRDRLRPVLEQSSLLEFLGMAAPIAALAAISPVLIPHLYGPKWTPAVPLVAWIGLAAVLYSPALMQITLLYSRGRNIPTAVTAAIRESILVIVALLLVPHLGVDGYGIAVACGFVGIVWIDHAVRREFVSFGYALIIPFAIALVPVVVMPLVPWPWSLLLLLPGAVVICFPGPRQTLAKSTGMVRAGLRRRAGRDGAAAESGELPPEP